MVYHFPLLAKVLVLRLNHRPALAYMFHSPQYLKNLGREATVKKPKCDLLMFLTWLRIHRLSVYFGFSHCSLLILPGLRQRAAVLGIWYLL